MDDGSIECVDCPLCAASAESQFAFATLRPGEAGTIDAWGSVGGRSRDVDCGACGFRLRAGTLDCGGRWVTREELLERAQRRMPEMTDALVWRAPWDLRWRLVFEPIEAAIPPAAPGDRAEDQPIAIADVDVRPVTEGSAQ